MTVPADRMAPAVGARVAQYRLVSPLGAGGMGQVFRAEDVRLRRHVALKFVSPELLREPQALARFELEARAIAALNHPHITTLYEFSAEQGFMSLELVEGQTLQTRLAGGPLPTAEAVRVGLAVCRALGHAHARGILHRDVKPSNILLGEDGTVKLTDFGVSRIRDATLQSTSGSMAGTAAYLCPERVMGQRSDGRGDLFSLGVVLYESLSGRLPWTGSGMAVLYALLHESPLPLAPLRPDVPAMLSAIVERLLRKDPGERFASAEELETHLDEVRLAAPGGAPGGGPTVALRPEAAGATPTAREATAADAVARLPLLGREQEMRRLGEALDRARAGVGSAVLVVAEAGMGKTRLLEEFRQLAAARGALVLEGACEYGGGRNFQPFVEALEDWLQHGEGRGAGDDGEPARRERDDPVSLLGDVLGAAPGESMGLDNREQIWYRLDTAFKRIASRGALVLLVEDLHWADEGTLRFFHHMARNVGSAAVLLVATWRPEETTAPSGSGTLEDVVRLLASVESFLELPLHPLTLEQTERLAAALLPHPRLARVVAPHLQARCEGNPFFTIEMLRLLAGGEELERGLTTTAARQLDTLSLPRTVQDVVARRLARLPDETRDLLEVAAVEGVQFRAEVLEEATRSPRIALLKQLRDLDRVHHLVAPVPGGYRFTHGLVREALLRELTPDLEREYHGAVAHVLQRAFGDRPDYAGEIGGHLHQAGRDGEALAYLTTAARESERLFLSDRALGYWDLALVARAAADAAEPSRAELLIARSRALLALGRFDEAHAAADEARRLAEENAEPRAHAEALQTLGHAALERGDLAGSEPLLRDAAAACERLGLWRRALECRARLGVVSVRRGDFDEALARFEQALASKEAAEDEREAARIRLETARVHHRRGRFDAALATAERAVDDFRRLGDRYALARALMQAGNSLFQGGDRGRARPHYDEALSIATEIGDLQAVAQLQGNLGNLHLQAGDGARAREAYQEALERFREIGDRAGMGHSLMALGNASFQQGRYAEAAESFTRSLGMREELGDRWGIANATCNLGRTEYLLGRFAPALEHTRAALAIREELGDASGIPESCHHLGGLLTVLGDFEQADALLERALKAAIARSNTSRLVVEVLLAQACLALWRGRRDVALAHLEQSRAGGSAADACTRRTLVTLARDLEPEAEAEAALREAASDAAAAGAIPERAAASLALAELLRRTRRSPAAELRDAAAQARHAGLTLHEYRALTMLEASEVSEAPDRAARERLRELAEALAAGLPAGAPLPDAWRDPTLPLP